MSLLAAKNREILPLADNQMSFFNCINQEEDSAKTLKRLQALGFNSIIFDTNSDTIEQDPNGTLHQKVNKFLSFIDSKALHLDITYFDREAGIAFVLLPPRLEQQ